MTVLLKLIGNDCPIEIEVLYFGLIVLVVCNFVIILPTAEVHYFTLENNLEAIHRQELLATTVEEEGEGNSH